MSDRIYRRWQSGACPCCGFMSARSAWPLGEPRLLAEGVWLCGRCAARDHFLCEQVPPPLLVPALLEALARRDDSCVEQFHPEAPAFVA